MTTQYINQAVSYSDGVNTLTLNANVGLQITDGTTTLTSNTTGFTNGVQSLLFSDLYAGVQKTQSIQYATSTATSLNVRDTILIDKVGFTQTTTIDNDSVTLVGGGVLGSASLGYDGLSIENNGGTRSIITTPKEITLTNGVTVNTLTATEWSGDSASSSTIALTSDNTSGSYFLPFAKTLSSTSTLFIDNVTGPLTYNPSTAVMSCGFFSGAILLPTTQNVATYAAGALSISGASNGQTPSFRSSSISFTGGSNTVSSLTLTNMIVGGRYRCAIYNGGSNNLTLNTGLGTNIKTSYSGSFNIPTGRYAYIFIDVLTVNALTIYIINASVLTN
jgi:hypothetical protein